ncbi:GumC family protein [Phenylobacterium sp. VNQ135]
MTGTPPARPVGAFTLRDLLRPVFFFRRRVLAAFLIPFLFALAVALVTPPVYVAQSRLLILLGDDYVFRSPLGGAVPGLSFDRSQIVNAETEILRSREVAQQVVEALGPGRMYPGTFADAAGVDAAVKRFQADLTIEDIGQSNVVKLSYRNGNRDIAVRALAKLTEIYLERRRSVFEQADQSSIQQQTDGVKRQLAEVEGQIAAFSTRNAFADYDLEVRSVQTQQAALLAQLESLNQEVAVREGRVAALEARKAVTAPELEQSTDLGRSQSLDALTQSLMTLRAQRREAAAAYVEGNALVADLDRRIRNVEAEIAAAPKEQVTNVRRAVNPVYQQLLSQLEDARADAGGFRRGRANTLEALRRTNEALDRLVQIGPEYRDLVRTRTLLESAMSELTKRAQDLQLTQAVSPSQANVRVLEAAQAPLESHSGRMLLVVGGFVVGLVSAGAVLLFSIAVFEGMLTPREAEEKLLVPVLLSPLLQPGRPLEPAVAGVPQARFADADDMQALVLLLEEEGRPRRSMMFIGPDDGVGVTNLLIDLGLARAREGVRTLLLDLEPLEGRAAADLLRERGALLHVETGGSFAQVGASGLDVLLPYPGPRPNLTEAEWRMLMDQARKEYDLVLVDGPPLSRSYMSLFAAPVVESIVAVIAAEKTRASVARNLIERIQAAGGPVLAAILNKRRYHLPEPLYRRL